MTSTQLAILRTIYTKQPIMKDDLYRLLSIPLNSAGHYSALFNLRKRGYIQYSRMSGPVWLTVKGRGVIDAI